MQGGVPGERERRPDSAPCDPGQSPVVHVGGRADARPQTIATIHQCVLTVVGLDVAANPGQVHGVVNSRGSCVYWRDYLKRALLLLLALAFLFETWIWDRVVAVGGRIFALVPWVKIRAVLIRLIDRLPVWVALLMFGIPFVVAETGAAFCVLIAATGHILVGGVGYIVVKTLGFGLVVPIFDLTRERLMTLSWFAYLYEKLLVFHHFALGLIEPYRAAARKVAAELLARVRAQWNHRSEGANEEAR
jgi:hypothetical protein